MTNDEAEYGGEDEVGGGSGKTDKHGVALGISQVVGVELDGLTPAEADDKEGDGADGVEMSEGV